MGTTADPGPLTAGTGVAATAATVVAEAETTSAAEPLRAGGRPDDRAAAARLVQLFERHGGTVLGHCRGLLRDEHEAQDAFQQTFLSAYRSLLGGVEPRHSAAWLATIARNECWRISERRMREPVDGRELPTQLPDPSAEAALRADLQQLWTAIAELPGPQREALLLRELAGLSYSELAVRLDVSEPAVESLLFRARRQLRERLRVLFGSVASVAAPFSAVRDALARLLGSTADPSVPSGLATPLAAKLAAGAATVMAVSGTVAAVESTSIHRDLTPRAEAAVALRRAAVAPVRRSLPPPPVDVSKRTPRLRVRTSLPIPPPASPTAPARQAATDASDSAPASFAGDFAPPRVRVPVPVPPPSPLPSSGSADPQPSADPAPGDGPGDDDPAADPTASGGGGSGVPEGGDDGGSSGDNSGPGSSEEGGGSADSGSSGPGGGEGSSGSDPGTGEHFDGGGGGSGAGGDDHGDGGHRGGGGGGSGGGSG